jgi:hypothetical protein
MEFFKSEARPNNVAKAVVDDRASQKLARRVRYVKGQPFVESKSIAAGYRVGAYF